MWEKSKCMVRGQAGWDKRPTLPFLMAPQNSFKLQSIDCGERSHCPLSPLSRLSCQQLPILAHTFSPQNKEIISFSSKSHCKCPMAPTVCADFQAYIFEHLGAGPKLIQISSWADFSFLNRRLLFRGWTKQFWSFRYQTSWTETMGPVSRLIFTE